MSLVIRNHLGRNPDLGRLSELGNRLERPRGKLTSSNTTHFIYLVLLVSNVRVIVVFLYSLRSVCSVKSPSLSSTHFQCAVHVNISLPARSSAGKTPLHVDDMKVNIHLQSVCQRTEWPTLYLSLVWQPRSLSFLISGSD